jgi:hypothetical protein
MESEEILGLQFSVHWSTCSSIPGSDFLSAIRIKYLLAIMLTVALLSSFLVVSVKAADQGDIQTAIDQGVQALVDLQCTDGSWHEGTWSDSHPIATTCLALVKLQERAYDLGYSSPFDAAYEYSDAVINGWEFVLVATKITKTTPLTVQPAGNPDVNGNEYGLDFATATGERYGYTQGICLMALASTGTPDRENEGGLDFNGDGNADTYLELAQDVAEHLAYGQVDSGVQQGGWHYTLADNAALAADNSVTGYAVLGLAYAETFGVALPAFVKPETDIWVNYIQCTDGGSGYNAPVSSNELRTGNLIFEMTFVDGATAPTTVRFQDALAYIEQHWRDANMNPGWGYSLSPCADYQAMYTLMKGLEYSNIDLIDTDGDTVRDNDWFNQDPSATPAQDFASVLVQQQDLATGLWPSTCHQYGDQALCQIWALLILEKTAPPPPAIEVSLDIHPTSCPNPLNTKSKGVMPVAILGTEDFDVTQVDPSTIRLIRADLTEPVEVSLLRWAMEDVATPYEPNGEEACYACNEEGPDGFMDLTLKFKSQEVVAAIGEVSDRECIMLTITGNLKEEFGSTSITGEDVVRIIKK